MPVLKEVSVFATEVRAKMEALRADPKVTEMWVFPSAVVDITHRGIAQTVVSYTIIYEVEE